MAELTLATLAAQAFTGLVLGMILVLLAIGLSLIFGLMTVVNFAHGSLYMLGAYLGFFLIGYTKSFWLALVVAPLLVGALGFGIERFLVRPLYGRSIDDPLLLTFGLSLVMVETVRLIWGKIGLTLDPPRELAGGVYAEMGVTIIIESFVVVVVGGMGSLVGAIVAGIAIGEVVSLTTLFAPKFAEIMVFIVMALVLLIRPSGLFGESGLME